MANGMFSRRYNHVPAATLIQRDAVDESMRVDLWNEIYETYFAQDASEFVSNSGPNRALYHNIWKSYFRKPIDDMPNWVPTYVASIKHHFMNGPWFSVYDFLESLVLYDVMPPRRELFILGCNEILESGLSAYRFVNTQIAPITSEQEVAAIDQALQDAQALVPVRAHLSTALALLANRQTPDYRNSIEESISAVEALCGRIASQPHASLGAALSIVETRIPLHGALKGSFDKLYGYTSNASGIRHALLDEPDLELMDAQFMLVSCSAFVSYLISKATRAGLSL